MGIHARSLAARSATGLLLASLTLLACESTDQAAEDRRTNAALPEGNVIFFDDFLGTSIDSTKWTVFDRLGDQANREVHCVAPENVSVKDGLLEGVSKYEDRRCEDSLESPKTMHYTSWQIQQATQPFLYGTIEVRAKAPGGVGTWPTIWMLGFKWQASQPLHGQYTRAPMAQGGLV